MENISKKNKLFNEFDAPQNSKRRRTLLNEIEKKTSDTVQQVAVQNIPAEALEYKRIEILNKELDIQYIKNGKNEKIIQKIEKRAKFVTENSNELRFTKSETFEEIFVSDISLKSEYQKDLTRLRRACILTITLSVGQKLLKLSCNLSARHFEEKYLKVLASVKEINTLYIKLNQLFGHKKSVPLYAETEGKSELDIDALTTYVFKNVKHSRHLQIQGYDFFCTEDLAGIFVVQDEKGSGSRAKVYRVMDILDPGENKVKALRKVECSITDQESLSGIENGSEVLAFLHKTNNEQPIKGIQKLIGNVTLIEETEQFASFFTVSDLAYDNLFDYAIEKKMFATETISRRVSVLRELLEGLEFTHNNQIVHGDIKPENVLVYLNENGFISHLLICDWDGATSNNEYPRTRTETYRPLTNDENYTKYDVFAAAKTLAEALNQDLFDLEQQNRFQTKPFNENSQERQIKLLREFQINEVPKEIVDALVKGLSSPIPSITELKESFQLETI